MGRHSFSEAGLWQVVFKFGNTPLKSFPAQESPYYEARGLAAVSPRLPDQPPLVLTAQRREPGSILAKLQDSQGKALRGYVFLDPQTRFVHDADCAGTTNAAGEVRFDGVQAGQHTVEAMVPHAALPPLETDDMPLPEEKSLIGQLNFFPQSVQVVFDGIWLSPAFRLVVGSDPEALRPLVLDIAEPGIATTIEVVNPKGRPIPGRR